MVWITEDEYNANKYKITEFCNFGTRAPIKNVLDSASEWDSVAKKHNQPSPKPTL